MEFNRQTGRPAPRAAQSDRNAPAAAANHSTSGSASHTTHAPKRRGSNRKQFIVIALVTVILLTAGFVAAKFVPALQGEYGRVDTSKYQAVFLTNDQVYFGKIKAINDDVVVITDIYYLQKGSDQAADAKQDTAAPAQQSNMSLAKLGNELHAPVDQMQINKDQVLFWENLKADGKVAQAIESYKK